MKKQARSTHAAGRPHPAFPGLSRLPAAEANKIAQLILESPDGQAWREMSFRSAVGMGGKDELAAIANASNWEPVTVRGANHTHQWVAELAVGRHYAAELIGHLVEQARPSNHDNGEDLLNVVRAMFAPRKLGGIEESFFRSIGEYIACGKIRFSDYFEAVSDFPVASAGDGKAEA